MARISLLLGGGLLLASAGLFGSASALVPLNPVQLSDLTTCRPKGDVQQVQLTYGQGQTYDIFVPVNGNLHTIGISTEMPQLKCAYIEQGTCNQKTCNANPVQIQALGASGISCSIAYFTPSGDYKSTDITKTSSGVKIPGHLNTISCQWSFGGKIRDLESREDTTSNIPAINTTTQAAQDGLKGCIGGSDLQRIDWFLGPHDDFYNRYSLFIARDAKPNTMDPPEVKCTFPQTGGIWSCGPCNLLFYMIDIDTPDTICQVLLDRLGGQKYDIKIHYGTWKIIDGCHPDKIACYKDPEAAAELVAKLAGTNGDLGPVQLIEKLAEVSDNVTFPSTAEEFTFVDGVKARD